MTTSRAIVSMMIAVFIGCATPPPAGTKVDSRLLTRDEIAQSGLVGNAYDVLSRLRPTFIKGRGQSSIKAESESIWPNVYLDGVFYGDINSLRTIDSFQIAEARLYQAWEAQTKFGMNNASGVIDITTRRQ